MLPLTEITLECKGGICVQRKPDVDDEEIGMRAFNLRKARAVERAIQKIRHGLGSDWKILSLPEVELLSWGLGETWAYIARTKWDKIYFSSMTLEKAKEIIEISKKIIFHEELGTKGIEQIYKILDSLSPS